MWTFWYMGVRLIKNRTVHHQSWEKAREEKKRFSMADLEAHTKFLPKITIASKKDWCRLSFVMRFLTHLPIRNLPQKQTMFIGQTKNNLDVNVSSVTIPRYKRQCYNIVWKNNCRIPRPKLHRKHARMDRNRKYVS